MARSIIDTCDPHGLTVKRRGGQYSTPLGLNSITKRQHNGTTSETAEDLSLLIVSTVSPIPSIVLLSGAFATKSDIVAVVPAPTNMTRFGPSMPLATRLLDSSVSCKIASNGKSH